MITTDVIDRFSISIHFPIQGKVFKNVEFPCWKSSKETGGKPQVKLVSTEIEATDEYCNTVHIQTRAKTEHCSSLFLPQLS